MLTGVLKAMRPHQWVKNLFVLAPLVFAKGLTDPTMLTRALIGFVAFCLASSAVYLMNDICDAEADRAHPIKCHRPIASGLVPTSTAAWIGFALVTVALGAAFSLGVFFLCTLLGYVALNVGYSFGLKRVPYIDVLCIATGFELRVIGGTFAAQVPPTVYLLVVTFLLAAFLGFGKRQHELLQGKEAHLQRQVLSGYSERALNVLLLSTAITTVATYGFYTIDPHTLAFFGSNRLIWSIPFAVFGVFRFLYLVRNRPDAESPTEQMLTDLPFVINLFAWGIATLAIIYA